VPAGLLQPLIDRDIRNTRTCDRTTGVLSNDPKGCLPGAHTAGLHPLTADGRCCCCCQVVRFPYVANELYSMGQWARLARRRIEAYMRHLAGGSNSTEHRSMRWREVRRRVETTGRNRK
jgi:hypothetical protein